MTSAPRRTATIVPLAVLSFAACVHLVQAPAPAAPPLGPAYAAPRYAVPGAADALAPVSRPVLPTSVPTGDGSLTATVTTPVAVTATASSVEIPALALSAYQRAESVINAADPGCRLQWQLVAAIGHIESDHGRHGGSTLDTEGRATPAIIGMRLDGSSGTARIADTDGGELDGDIEFDRAVGPMQFIPSTWASVGVDADGDDVRDPQDIDDAALGAAVYLCSADDDLGTDAGRRSALLRYNHSTAYVEQVLQVMADYMDADVTLPVSTVVAAGVGTTAPQAGVTVPSGDDVVGPVVTPVHGTHAIILGANVPVGPTRPGTDAVGTFPGGTLGDLPDLTIPPACEASVTDPTDGTDPDVPVVEVPVDGEVDLTEPVSPPEPSDPISTAPAPETDPAGPVIDCAQAGF